MHHMHDHAERSRMPGDWRQSGGNWSGGNWSDYMPSMRDVRDLGGIDAGVALIMGVGLGALLMYFLDPVSGASRRSTTWDYTGGAVGDAVSSAASTVGRTSPKQTGVATRSVTRTRGPGRTPAASASRNDRTR